MKIRILTDERLKRLDASPWQQGKCSPTCMTSAPNKRLLTKGNILDRETIEPYLDEEPQAHSLCGQRPARE